MSQHSFPKKRKESKKKLKLIVADLQVYLQSLLSYQWSIQATKRSELHQLFHRHSEEIEMAIDLMVDRIKSYKSKSTSAWFDSLKASPLKSNLSIKKPQKILSQLLEQSIYIRKKLNAVQKLAFAEQDQIAAKLTKEVQAVIRDQSIELARAIKFKKRQSKKIKKRLSNFFQAIAERGFINQFHLDYFGQELIINGERLAYYHLKVEAFTKSTLNGRTTFVYAISTDRDSKGVLILHSNDPNFEAAERFVDKVMGKKLYSHHPQK